MKERNYRGDKNNQEYQEGGQRSLQSMIIGGDTTYCKAPPREDPTLRHGHGWKVRDKMGQPLHFTN